MRLRLKRSGRSGQSTVEFMLMVPVIFAVYFFVIEMGLYFSAIHYTNYATFITARSKQVGYQGPSGSKSASYVAKLVMTGGALKNNFQVNESSSGIQLKVRTWKPHFPFLTGLMPDAPFATRVNLGGDERIYESRAFTGCADNDINSDPC